MFDNLSDKLQRVFKNLRGEGKLSAENMEAALREIRVALLEADVHFRVVKQFIENIREKAMGQEVLTALSPTQQVVKIVRDEMVRTLGSHIERLPDPMATSRFPCRVRHGIEQPSQDPSDERDSSVDQSTPAKRRLNSLTAIFVSSGRALTCAAP